MSLPCEVKANKPSLTLTWGPTAGQAGCLQGQDRSVVTHPSSCHARHCFIWLSCNSHCVRYYTAPLAVHYKYSLKNSQRLWLVRPHGAEDPAFTRVLQVRWHPLQPYQLLVLYNDNRLRLMDAQCQTILNILSLGRRPTSNPLSTVIPLGEHAVDFAFVWRVNESTSSISADPTGVAAYGIRGVVGILDLGRPHWSSRLWHQRCSRHPRSRQTPLEQPLMASEV
ncbi:hypothetical protein J6590_009184 [Homalodisca vitripennis]|nr:hypothetical protein J6590_009184 [Homalodisca vitripennis]